MKMLTPHPQKPMPWLIGRDWPEFWRVRLPDSGMRDEKKAWCNANIPKRDWGTSFGGEVFYFVRLEDATAFKLRWEGAKS